MVIHLLCWPFSRGWRDIAQWLRVLAALAEGASLVPSMHLSNIHLRTRCQSFSHPLSHPYQWVLLLFGFVVFFLLMLVTTFLTRSNQSGEGLILVPNSQGSSQLSGESMETTVVLCGDRQPSPQCVRKQTDGCQTLS